MSVNKLCLMVCLCLLCTFAQAESPSIISQEMISTETVNYSKTAEVQLGDYRRDYNASASEYYPYTLTLAPEVTNASFLKYHVARSQQVKKGDVLATFQLDVDEAAITSARLSLESTRKAYETGVEEREEALDELIQASMGLQDSYERELAELSVRRERTALEIYIYQQECQIENLERALRELEEENSQSHLVAPFDGVITAITYKREGEKVYKNEGLVTLYREDGLLVKIRNDQMYFRYGMPVTVTSGNKNEKKVYQGTVVAADNLLPQSRRQGIAYIRIDGLDPEDRLVRLTVTGTSESLDDVLLIPRRAATMEGGNYYVERLVNGAIQKRFINVGLNTMSDMWVVQGLEAGETVVID